jgi:hypothetical protein
METLIIDVNGEALIIPPVVTPLLVGAVGSRKPPDPLEKCHPVAPREIFTPMAPSPAAANL